MDIKIEKIGDLHELLKIQIVPEDYLPEVDKVLKSLKNKAEIPGFRKGFTPMGLIEKKYGAETIGDVVMKMVEEEVKKYFKNNENSLLFEILPVDSDMIDAYARDSISRDRVFDFSFEAGFSPDIQVDFDLLKGVIYYKIKPSDADIEDKIDYNRRRYGKYVSAETVTDNDMILVTVTPDMGGGEFKTTLPTSYLNEQGLSEVLGKNLKDEFDLDLTLTFKSDYARATFFKVPNEDLEKVPKIVHVKIEAIHHIELAALDEEFFKQVSTDNTTIHNEQELRQVIADLISEETQNEIDKFYHDDILKCLFKHVELPLPDTYLKHYFVKNDEYKDVTEENIEEKYPSLAEGLRYQLLDRQLVKALNVKMDDESFYQFVNEYYCKLYFNCRVDQLTDENLKELHKVIQLHCKDDKTVSQLFYDFKGQHVVHTLKEKLSPPEKEVSFAEFVTLRTVKPEELEDAQNQEVSEK
ncbi:MAG: hypothetical protein LBR36_06920 [Bacteroidales bacterium]|jgi:trigger factor|nr:hypothetical protein [Bacteroidales bacterium]